MKAIDFSRLLRTNYSTCLPIFLSMHISSSMEIAYNSIHGNPGSDFIILNHNTGYRFLHSIVECVK